MRKYTITIIVLIIAISCRITKSNEKYYSNDLIEKVKSIQDSIVVGKMTIHNAFKHQILAHSSDDFDSQLIINKVYNPNRYVFENCLSLIFGEENREKFDTTGIHKWNKNLLREHEELIRQKISVLDSVDINKLFLEHLTATEKITGQKGEGTWMIYFGPKGFQIFGGCDRKSMVLDMMGEAWNTKSLNILFAHEIEHSLFEPILDKDPNGNTGLGITLDEGLAVYFTYIYLKQEIGDVLFTKNTNVLFKREKEIFENLEPFLFKGEDEGCPIYKHCDRGNTCEFLIKDIPEDIRGSLCYFIGFRIIEKYVEKYGEHSWKEIYNIPLKEFYEKSGYKEFITEL